ncbi:MAG TPA: GNAT family N-acetyltransferase [Dongiaceae bacterium]|nr:GNAT family N-acetyltransferase [Dongiaceae bacterium]
MDDRGTLRIDRATQADIPLLAALNLELYEDERHPYPLDLPALTERMARWVAGEYQVLLFRRGARVAGYAVWREEEFGAYLRQFFICRDQRRRGVGRAVMTLLRRDALPPDRPLHLEASVWNTGAIAFWRALGFRDFGLSMELKAGQQLK